MNYKFFRVLALPQEPKRKTRDYEIVNKNSGHRIGIIKWKNSWRKFCHFPEPETIWSIECLNEVAAAIKKITRDHHGEA